MRFLRCSPGLLPRRTGRRVAIIGAGPAGLGAAGVLVCKGHHVEIYDMMPEPGGLLIFGIPGFRMSKDRIRAGIRELQRAGVVFHLSTKVYYDEGSGYDVSLEELISSFDSVLIATGTWRSRRLGIPGESLRGVCYAMEWLADYLSARLGYKEKSEVPMPSGRVVVIGGGLTAVDVALTPIMYKDDFNVEEVVLSYRRTRREAPMGERGFKELEEKGVRTLELTSPVEFVGRDKLEAVKLIKMKLVEEPGARRPRPVPIKGSEFVVEADFALIAVGLIPTPPFKSGCCGIELNPDGTIKTDAKYRTTRRKVFAAGDVRHGASLIGPALRSGVDAANCIHEFLLNGEWWP